MPTLPNEVKVGPHCFRLRVFEHLRTEGGQEIHGWYRPDLDEIHLSAEILGRPMRLLQVILHETLHAISDQYGTDLCEEEIEQLSAGLAEALCENPALVGLLRQAACHLRDRAPRL